MGMPRTPRKQAVAGLETLETRALLSTTTAIPRFTPPKPTAPTVTLALDPASDPSGDGMVFQPRVTVEGTTMPGDIVRLQQGGPGHPFRSTRADIDGNYHFHVVLGQGQTALTATAFAPGSLLSGTADLTVTRANEVVIWNAVALGAIRSHDTPAPLAARNLAIVATAVDGAVNAVHRTHAPYHVKLSAPRGTSPDAAAAQAAHDALVALYPDEQPMFDATLTAALEGLKQPAMALIQGEAVGRQAAAQILAWRGADGAATAQGAYTPGTAPGQWQPTPPSYAPAVLPEWSLVTPFAIQSASQFRPAGPPALNSAEYAQALAQVMALGSAGSTVRTADQTQAAKFWNDGAGTSTPPGHWNVIAEDVSLAHHTSLARDAQMFAVLDIAMADTGIATWDAKYAYNFWRPETAARDTDPTWTPLLTTPAFPSYVSGHSAFSAAASTVLSAFFGASTPFTATSDALPGVTRSYTNFAQAAQEAGLSRIYGGIHYAFDVQDGQTLGDAVGQYVVQHVLHGSSRAKG
jgi:hypothetical protein